MNCDEHPDEVCGCGLRVGQLQRRRGVLCAVDERGRLYVRAPRKADVQLAQRLVAAVESAAESGPLRIADITSVREKT